ncbi:MAG: CDP-paratose 2-epimerase [Chloroflexi bacterium]|jgi:CDP-paratose 2-epimerase|nr:MAG: CDP-paratose 2-epimerase [Chloroflexota bacterium]
MEILITGGVGFIGANLAAHMIKQGHSVTLLDNFHRSGVRSNLDWLREVFDDSFAFVEGDVRDEETVTRCIEGKEAVYHLAAQVAVTSSIQDPREDFAINAFGTLNVLEAVRKAAKCPILIYTSTNKVYGAMEDLRIGEEEDCYKYLDLPFGIPESFPLDFHSPYGCSKGSADQYVRDYARIYDLPAIVFRQSCIYGPRQFGMVDQGWLAHFVISIVNDRPIAIYGDGKQVRDLLHIDDLVRAMDWATQNIDATHGQVYNIGGGPSTAMSVWAQVGPILENLAGRELSIAYDDWRPGDQRVYVSDIRKAEADFQWSPEIMPKEGLEHLWEWVTANRPLFHL